MTQLKCPFCQQELEIGGVDGVLRGCPKCRNLGTEMLWQALIDTKKKLDIAVGALKYIGYDENDELDGLEEFAIAQMVEKACKTLEQINQKKEVVKRYTFSTKGTDGNLYYPKKPGDQTTGWIADWTTDISKAMAWKKPEDFDCIMAEYEDTQVVEIPK